MTAQAEVHMAHNTETSGGGACPVITSLNAIEAGDVANWHEASGSEYQAYLDYWNAELECGHERGDHCRCGGLNRRGYAQCKAELERIKARRQG